MAPDKWRKQSGEAESLMRQGHRAYQFVMPRPGDLRYTLKTAQHFDAMADLEKRHAAAARPAHASIPRPRDPRQTAPGGGRDADGYQPRRRFHAPLGFAVRIQARAAKNQHLTGKSVAEIAREQNKDVLDAFLDLALEENLETDSNGAKSTATRRP